MAKLGEKLQRGSIVPYTTAAGVTTYTAHARDERGKRICRRGFPSREAGIAWLEEVTPQVRAKRFLRNKVEPITLSAYAESYIASRVATGALRPSSGDQYRSHLRRLERAGLGAMMLDQITAEDVRRFLSQSERIRGGDRPLGVRVKRTAVIFLASLFEAGMSETPKRCLENPLKARSFKLPKLDKSEHPLDILSPAEASAVLDQCPREWGTFFLVLAGTGIRIGEGGALRWRDFDAEAGTLTIARSHYMGRMGPTKSGKHRTVDLTDQVLYALQAYRTETFGTGPVDGDRLMFEGRKAGRPMTAAWARRVWRAASARAGVRHVKIHGLRHLWASVALRTSRDPKWVQGQLGHASAVLTFDTYGHAMKERRRATLAAIEASFRDGAVTAHPPKTETTANDGSRVSARLSAEQTNASEG